MPTVAAHYGYLGAQDEVRQWGADHIIQSPLELLALLP
jgi:phosphoglycolate phosphatase-like HAD superfamily hydrolase